MFPSSTWQPPPSRLAAPRGGAVHVWLVELDLAAAEVRRLRDVLSEDEQARADRFHFERDRRRFTVARGVLRTLSGMYLDRAARDVRFDYQTLGKPFFADAADDLRFNVSHAGEVALIGFACGRDLGVDVEAIRPVSDMLEIARRFFSPSECAALESLPGAVQPRAFFTCWTRKEAFIKATGEGLSLPLDAFDVSLLPGAPAALLGLRVPYGQLEGWRLYALEPGQGYVGALAIEGDAAPLERWRWPR